MICYDYINNYIRGKIKKSSGVLKELEEYAEKNHIPIVHPEVAALLRVLCSIKKPEKILEIGTAIGYSAIVFANLLKPGGRVDTIERYDVMMNMARENVDKSGLAHVINLIYGDASEVLKSLDMEYDVIFLDGAKGQYLDFLPECMRILKKGGIIISDNVLYKGMIANDGIIVRRKKTIVKRLRAYLDIISNHEELETSILSVGDGVAVSCKK